MSSNPSEVFSKRLEDLRLAAKYAGTETVEHGYPLNWMGFDSDADNDASMLDSFDDEKIRAAFDRTETEKQYADAISMSGGQSKPYRNMQAAKVQGDVLSALERDLRMRYRTRVRMIAHASARVITHGLENGPVSRGIGNFVKLLLEGAKEQSEAT